MAWWFVLRLMVFCPLGSGSRCWMSGRSVFVEDERWVDWPPEDEASSLEGGQSVVAGSLWDSSSDSSALLSWHSGNRLRVWWYEPLGITPIVDSMVKPRSVWVPSASTCSMCRAISLRSTFVSNKFFLTALSFCISLFLMFKLMLDACKIVFIVIASLSVVERFFLWLKISPALFRTKNFLACLSSHQRNLFW